MECIFISGMNVIMRVINGQKSSIQYQFFTFFFLHHVLVSMTIDRDEEIGNQEKSERNTELTHCDAYVSVSNQKIKLK